MRMVSQQNKHITNEISEAITFIINQSISTGVFPDPLKIAQVKSLFKKGDKHNASNYRPISLLSSLSKIFEKVRLNQLIDHFDKKLPFPF